MLSDDLEKVKTSWNSHHIRPSRHDSVSGCPDVLFYLPQRSGGVDNLQEVSDVQIAEWNSRLMQGKWKMNIRNILII